MKKMEKASLKETFLALVTAVGFVMLVWIIVRLTVLIAGKTPISFFLFNPYAQGFEIPLIQNFYVFLGKIHTWVMDEAQAFLEKFLWRDKFYLTVTCFLMPFVEEIEWRGFFFLTRGHAAKAWWKIGFLLTAIVFSLCHVHRGIGLTIGPFTLAMTAGYLIKKTGKFYPLWVNHALFNVACLVSAY